MEPSYDLVLIVQSWEAEGSLVHSKGVRKKGIQGLMKTESQRATYTIVTFNNDNNKLKKPEVPKFCNFPATTSESVCPGVIVIITTLLRNVT